MKPARQYDGIFYATDGTPFYEEGPVTLEQAHGLVAECWRDGSLAKHCYLLPQAEVQEDGTTSQVLYLMHDDEPDALLNEG